MSKYDFIIIGSGLYGLVFNYLCKINNYTSLIIERRPHIGGNIYTPTIDGIPIHQYGAHIFHTNDKKIWDFVSSLCEMTSFINSPIANYKGEIYNLPFNMNTFSKIFNISTPEEAKQKIEEEIFKLNITNPSNLEEQALSMVGETVYKKLIKEYTEKQWGKKCKELESDIIKRIPLRFTYDNNYFNDTYQGIPKGGYNTLIENLLGDTEIIYDDYLNNKEYYNSLGRYVIYTGPIDEYFQYCEGVLEWRSLDFKLKKYDVQNYQGNAVVNYTSHNVPYTRTIEHKFFDLYGLSFNKNITYISEEYPIKWDIGKEPFYPIYTKENLKKLSKYNKLVNNEKNIFFGGRLGEYKYYDMDNTIFNAINKFKKIIGNEK
jgi:UDP-galactopyranose mutase